MGVGRIVSGADSRPSPGPDQGACGASDDDDGQEREKHRPLQLVQVASTPILAVRADAATLPHRIVVGIDFTPSSLLAVRTASRLLAAGDSLHLVHVRSPADTRAALASDAASGKAPPDIDARLTELAASLGLPEGVAVDHVVLGGEPPRVLLDELARVQGDLIALGSHGYGLWKRLTLGSVASKVLRLATTSVLVQPIGSVTSPAAVITPGSA